MLDVKTIGVGLVIVLAFVGTIIERSHIITLENASEIIYLLSLMAVPLLVDYHILSAAAPKPWQKLVTNGFFVLVPFVVLMVAVAACFNFSMGRLQLAFVVSFWLVMFSPIAAFCYRRFFEPPG